MYRALLIGMCARCGCSAWDKSSFSTLWLSWVSDLQLSLSSLYLHSLQTPALLATSQWDIRIVAAFLMNPIHSPYFLAVDNPSEMNSSFLSVSLSLLPPFSLLQLGSDLGGGIGGSPAVSAPHSFFSVK